MRYINSRFTYLLTYLKRSVAIRRTWWLRERRWNGNSRQSNNDEVEPVPSVPQEREVSQNESSSQNLCQSFGGVDGCEDFPTPSTHSKLTVAVNNDAVVPFQYILSLPLRLQICGVVYKNSTTMSADVKDKTVYVLRVRYFDVACHKAAVHQNNNHNKQTE